ncbi:hypothetical protein [Coprobacter fastidiosus]|uniref:hypothetical protein n=1 Tax=Coprobacter fastidiosus TaxID=1099853 RepID=UPI000240EF65|nr:hypothetical protein [Coprobacter fastidiosus]EHL81972.1 hypothetical protein HMPREF1033_02635 [Tannerella sp. 6_1_58FAA_CT1]
MKAIKFFLFCTCLLMIACGDEDGAGNEHTGYAPASIIGKDLCLSRDSDMDSWYVKILQTRNELKMVAQDWELGNLSCRYDKTGNNQAKLKISYTITILDKQVRHTEELNILFTSEHGGTFSGTDKVSSDGNTYEQESSGYFTFDTGELSDFDDEATGDEDVDFSYLCNSWKLRSSEKYLTFYPDKTYLIVTNDNGYREERGSYRIDVATSLIYLTSDQGTTKQYEVDLLIKNELEWRQYNQQTGKYSYETYLYSDKDGTENKPGGSSGTEESESDVLYVSFEEIARNNITTNRVEDYLKYKLQYKNPENYTSSSKYLKAGICYGTSPHPTIFKDKTTQQSKVDPKGNVVLLLSGLEDATTYYLRPYTEENGKVTYYKETEITTFGKYVNAEVVRVGKDRCKIDYTIASGTYEVTVHIYNYATKKDTYEHIGYKRAGDSGSSSIYNIPYGIAPYGYGSGLFINITFKDIDNPGHDYTMTVSTIYPEY